jgi:hypothetical protein
MFNRDGVIDKKEESQRNGLRNVNLTPDLAGTPAKQAADAAKAKPAPG